MPLASINKPGWNTDMLIYLCFVHGHCHAPMSKLNRNNRYFLHENLADLARSLMSSIFTWSISIVSKRSNYIHLWLILKSMIYRVITLNLRSNHIRGLLITSKKLPTDLGMKIKYVLISNLTLYHFPHTA